MKLDGWDEGHVFVQTSHERLNFDFPMAVVAPETTQEETYKIICPELVDAWLIKCCHVQLLAYGQTGTGKTHTMFGTRESLSSPDPSPDWGIFPRVVHKCFDQMREACQIFTKCKWSLTASAAEFYMTSAFDLLHDRAPVLLNPVDCSPVGLAAVRIDSVSDLVPFLDTVNSTRTMSKTKMNAGSSRSHCALILTLCQTDQSNGEYMSTTFTVVDLAGSERTSKTGAEFVAPTMLSKMMQSSKPLTPAQQQGAEGGLINFELSLFATEVQKASSQHTKKRRYIQPKGMDSTDTIKFLGRSLNGYCLMAMVVCISQAPQHGWETWFSCTYGQKLAMLRAPVKKVPLMDIHKEHNAARASLVKAKKAFEDTPQSGSPSSKYWAVRKNTIEGAAAYVQMLEELMVPLANCQAP